MSFLYSQGQTGLGKHAKPFLECIAKQILLWCDTVELLRLREKAWLISMLGSRAILQTFAQSTVM